MGEIVLDHPEEPSVIMRVHKSEAKRKSLKNHDVMTKAEGHKAK